MSARDSLHTDGSIPFLADYVEPILAGHKRATVRTALRSEWAIGRRLAATVKGKTFAIVKVTRVAHVTLAEITDLDARLLGEPNADAVRANLTSIYPGLKASKVLHLIRFQVLHAST